MYNRLASYTADLILEQRSLAFVQWLSCYCESHGNPLTATERFRDRWPGAQHDLVSKALHTYETRSFDDLHTNAATLPGTSTDAIWASPLVGIKPFADAFVALARSESLIGRIPRLRAAPFGVKVPIETSGATYAWVAQGAPKPVSKFSFTNGVQLTATKGQGIIVQTAELMRLAVPGAAEALRDDLIAGLVEFTDKSFLDPASAAIADSRPASITNGTTPIAGTGNVQTDISALLKAFFAARPGADTVVLVMGAGTLFEMPFEIWPQAPVTIVTSGAAAALGIMVALDPRGILVADNGIDVDESRQAVLEMTDAPAGGAGAVLTSLWHQNLVGLRVERTINWQAAPNAVKYLTLAA